MEVFWRYGYASTTPQGLADALGIHKGSLYNTFDSKHNLFTLALQRYRDTREQTLKTLREEQGPVREVLRSSMLELTGAGTHRRGCLAVNSVSELGEEDQVIARAGEALFSDIEDAFRAAVGRGQASGEFTGNRDAGEQARSLLVTVIGLSVLSRAGARSDRLNQIIDDALQSL